MKPWNVYEIIDTSSGFTTQLRHDLDDHNFVDQDYYKYNLHNFDGSVFDGKSNLGYHDMMTQLTRLIDNLKFTPSLIPKIHDANIDQLKVGLNNVTYLNQTELNKFNQDSTSLSRYAYYPMLIDHNEVMPYMVMGGGKFFWDNNPTTGMGTSADGNDSDSNKAFIDSGIQSMTTNLNNLLTYLSSVTIAKINTLSTDDTSNKALAGEIIASLSTLPTDVMGGTLPTTLEDFKTLQKKYNDRLTTIDDWYKGKVSDGMTIYDDEAKKFNDALNQSKGTTGGGTSLKPDDTGVPTNNPTIQPHDTDPNKNTNVPTGIDPDNTGNTDLSKSLLDAQLFGFPLYIGIPIIAFGSYFLMKNI